MSDIFPDDVMRSIIAEMFLKHAPEPTSTPRATEVVQTAARSPVVINVHVHLAKDQ